jgi:uncharacterized membrane protein YfcA
VLAVLQVCGSVLVLVAFALSQRNIVSTSSGTYLVLNVVGSALLAVLALHERQWGFLLLLNAVWAVVSGASLAGKLRPRRVQPPRLP